MKNKLKHLFYPLTFMSVFLFGIILVAGCSSSSTLISTTQNKNVMTLKTVLKQQFTGPDEIFHVLFAPKDNFTIIEKGGEVTLQNIPTKLEQYAKKHYQKYFTENTFNNFITVHAFRYQLIASTQGYYIKPDGIEIKKVKKTERTYDFKVNVIYEKSGIKQQNAEVSGRVNFNKDGKITFIRYLDDGGLIKAMNN
ncbi:hypothetical protein ABWK22_12155 [Gottfriedia acidiceleris]|uniref:hypothetical protein n=1 Tax=Gottfriedia acidiceleris TaxID=371036 RepID=UPI003395D559